MFFYKKKENQITLDKEVSDAYFALNVAQNNFHMAQDHHQQDICFHQLQIAKTRIDYIRQIKREEEVKCTASPNS